MTHKILCTVALFGVLLSSGAHPQAQAPEVLNPPAKNTAKKKAKSPKHATGAKAKFVSGSQETKKERTVRLTRECKDEVNAGACTGYTR